jgi:hypothetical protein
MEHGPGRHEDTETTGYEERHRGTEDVPVSRAERGVESVDAAIRKPHALL